MSAGTHEMKFDSARTVISASISSVSVTRQAAPIQPSRRASFSIASSRSRTGAGAAALRLGVVSLISAVRFDVPSPLVGEGYSEVQQRRLGEGYPSPNYPR